MKIQSLVAIKKINGLTTLIKTWGVGRDVTSQLKRGGAQSRVQICSIARRPRAQQPSGANPTRVEGSTCNMLQPNTGKRERKLNNKRHALHQNPSPCQPPTPSFFFLASLPARPINSSFFLFFPFFYNRKICDGCNCLSDLQPGAEIAAQFFRPRQLEMPKLRRGVAGGVGGVGSAPPCQIKKKKGEKKNDCFKVHAPNPWGGRDVEWARGFSPCSP